ncbi:MAG: FkbM family methyltransferase [Chitinophagaceae bacterium]|jgi:FkbM family methyltransferase|nr:FkbM family methyltransferase [Chitinophagaceae bacterium]
MLEKILASFRRKKLKKEFHEYGTRIDRFTVEPYGTIETAQWTHPFNEPFRVDEGIVSFYRQYLREGDFAIDIGAHTGDTTLPMALAVGKQGMVLALEPNKYVFRVLEENARLNPALTHIKPLCIAATAEDGTMTFNYSDASFCNGGYLSQRKVQDRFHKYTLQVEGRNLEHLLRSYYATYLQRLRFIKVDAEGYDKEIIRTLQPVIREFNPVLLSECNHYLVQAEREELFDIMSAGGRTLYMAHPEDSRSTIFRKVMDTPLTKRDLMKREHFDILSLPAGWQHR